MFELPKDASPALRVMAVFWQETRGSWRKLNHHLADALGSACLSLPFNREDFGIIHGGMSGGYWMGRDAAGGLGERFYRAACKAGNVSACQSFEFWQRRPAFFAPDGSRLFEGASVVFEGLPMRCTSLGPEGVVLCSYKTAAGRPCAGITSDGYFMAGITLARRVKVTREQLLAARKAVREAKKARKAPKAEEGVR